MTKKELEAKVEELTKRVEDLEKRQPYQVPFPVPYGVPMYPIVPMPTPCQWCGRTSGCPGHVIC